MKVRRRTLVIALCAMLAPPALYAALHRPFPSDRTPAGAYVRIAKSVADGDPQGFFAYLEQEAQWACFTIRDARAKAAARVAKSYPEPQRAELLAQYAPVASAADGSDVFAILYQQRGFARRLRKDLSGVVNVEISGERASVVTAQGTRWPFRRRDNGIWGITVFTAELVAEAEKATRDLGVVSAAADDYDRARTTR